MTGVRLAQTVSPNLGHFVQLVEPWATLSSRCYGHAAGMAGEDERGSAWQQRSSVEIVGESELVVNGTAGRGLPEAAVNTSLVGKSLMIGQLSLTTSFGLIVVGQDG